jgi:hypothetical protein
LELADLGLGQMAVVGVEEDPQFAAACRVHRKCLGFG